MSISALLLLVASTGGAEVNAVAPSEPRICRTVMWPVGGTAVRKRFCATEAEWQQLERYKQEQWRKEYHPRD
jgi:hypothetical protein